MFPLAKLILPPLTPPLAECLDLAVSPILRRVDLPALKVAIEDGRLSPARFLTPAEQDTLASFTFPKRRLEWLGGRLAAKTAALALAGQEVTAAALAGWQVSRAPDGRPGLGMVGALPRATTLELSISHSHGVAAAMVVIERPCGLDLQKITNTVVRVRECFCSEAEASLLPSAGLDPPTTGLSLLWAAKEALRKGRGGTPLTGLLAMRLTGLARLAGPGWCMRLAVAGAEEYPVVAFLAQDFAWAISVP